MSMIVIYLGENIVQQWPSHVLRTKIQTEYPDRYIFTLYILAETLRRWWQSNALIAFHVETLPSSIGK